MMIGSVLSRHALLPVTIHLPNKPDLSMEFVVDTGYTGYLTLPVAAVHAMGLPHLHRTSADLADDTTVELDVYMATILWHGAITDVPVLATGRRALLGTALLDDCELTAQFHDGGLVTVDAL